MNMCRKYQEKSETIQHKTGACRDLTQSDYTATIKYVSNIVHQEMATNVDCKRQN